MYNFNGWELSNSPEIKRVVEYILNASYSLISKKEWMELLLFKKWSQKISAVAILLGPKKLPLNKKPLMVAEIRR